MYIVSRSSTIGFMAFFTHGAWQDLGNLYTKPDASIELRELWVRIAGPVFVLCLTDLTGKVL